MSVEKRNDDSSALFGRPIVAESHGKTLISQVLEIFTDEIQAGRWEVGERLPSLAELTRQSGLNRGTLQYAMDKLAEAGYIRVEKYHGAFLLSANPGRRENGRGIIAIVTTEKFDEDPVLHAWHTRLQLRHIMQVAGDRGYSVQLHTFKENEFEHFSERLAETESKIAGIISFNTYPRPHAGMLPDNAVPLIFWRDCFHVADCLPYVGHDQPAAFYLMTRKLIELGHTNIVFLAHSLENELVVYSYDAEEARVEHQARFAGHTRAMVEAGLKVNSEAADFEVSDTDSLRQFLKKFSEATAIVCGAGHIAWKVYLMAEMIGIRIPRDLSLVAPGPACVQENGPMRLISGVDFNGSRAAELCFDMLEEQISERTNDCTRVLMAPRLVEGCTLAVPPAEKSAAHGGAMHAPSPEHAGAR